MRVRARARVIEATRHWEKQIHFSCFNCFVITVNREHRALPYFIRSNTASPPPREMQLRDSLGWTVLIAGDSFSAYARVLNVDNLRLTSDYLPESAEGRDPPCVWEG